MNTDLMYAKYNQAGNQTIYHILSKLSFEERTKDRGSFYGSLLELFFHIISGTEYFLSLYKKTLIDNDAAFKALEIPPIDFVINEWMNENLKFDMEKQLWKKIEKAMDILDAAYVTMAEALSAADLEKPIKVDWYGGNPAEVPLQFMLHQLVAHNIHHRGQISQILDSMKIDNDYSGINVAFM